MTTTTQKTALFDQHQALKGKCVPFAGYELPIWYSSIKEEHLVVRERVGMFDISHMGMYRLEGPHVKTFIQRLSCNSIQRSLNHTMIYSMFLNEQGMILDDVMFGFMGDACTLIVNGANSDKINHWMHQHLIDGVTITHLNPSHALIAVQGPKAAETLSSVLDTSLTELARFGMTTATYQGQSITLCRTGYTGEDGFECMIPQDLAPTLWTDCCDAGVTPCGLGARDSLRIEYGLPLYGQELSESIHPLMTRYQWVVKWDHDFIGKDALLSHKETSHLVAVGLELDQPVIARPDYPIKEGGYISSGTLSPLTHKSVALAFVSAEYKALGSRVTVQIRKREVEATVVKVPFI